MPFYPSDLDKIWYAPYIYSRMFFMIISFFFVKVLVFALNDLANSAPANIFSSVRFISVLFSLFGWNFLYAFRYVHQYPCMDYFLIIDLVKVKYRHFQLGTIYYRSIHPIWIKFGMRLTYTDTRGSFSWFFQYPFFFYKILIFELCNLYKYRHFQLGTIY